MNTRKRCETQVQCFIENESVPHYAQWEADGTIP